MKKGKAKAAADLTALLVTMASFYAGKPVTVAYGDRNTTGLAGSSAITIDKEVKASLEALLTGKSRDVYGLGTLIHEALHTRGPSPEYSTPDGAGVRDPNTGFYSWDDEWQARQLGYQLVPDAMQRFFGVKWDSEEHERFRQAAEQRSGGAFGSPPKDSVFGERVAGLYGGRKR